MPIPTRRTLGAQPFSPRAIPGLQLYLRADLGITLATGVSQWADQSGHGNDVLQATGAKQPVLTANALNGMPVLTFTSANSSNLAAAGTTTISTGNQTTFVVAKRTTGVAASVFSQYSGGGWDVYTPSGTLVAYYTTTGAAVHAQGTPGTAPLNNWLLYEGMYDGANASIAINGTAVNSVAQTGAQTTPSVKLCVGGDSGGAGGYIDGQVAAALIWNRALGTAELARVRAYLNALYRIY